MGDDRMNDDRAAEKAGAGAKLRAWLREVDGGFRNVGRFRPSPAMVVALIALGVSLTTGAYAAVNIPRNSIGAAQLKNSAVTAKKLKEGAVVGSKIADDAVRSRKIADGAVKSKEIADDAVKSRTVADGAIKSREIADGAVGSKEIAASSVGGTKLAEGAVGAGKIAPGAVGADKLAHESVGADKLADGAVRAGKIAPNAVGPKEIEESAVGASKLASGSVGASKLADGSVGASALQPLPSVRNEMTLGAPQTIPDDPWIDSVKVIYGHNIFDTGDLFDEANPERLTAPVDGIYDFSANVNWAANPIGSRSLNVRKYYLGGPGSVSAVGDIASQRIPAAPSGITPVSLNGTINMRAGDYLWVYPWQDSGGPLDLISSDSNISTFSLTFLSPNSP